MCCWFAVSVLSRGENMSVFDRGVVFISWLEFVVAFCVACAWSVRWCRVQFVFSAFKLRVSAPSISDSPVEQQAFFG